MKPVLKKILRSRHAKGFDAWTRYLSTLDEKERQMEIVFKQMLNRKLSAYLQTWASAVKTMKRQEVLLVKVVSRLFKTQLRKRMEQWKSSANYFRRIQKTSVRNPFPTIELASSAMQSVAFGYLQVGASSTQQVSLINHSKRTTTFQLKDPAGAVKGRLEELGVTFAPIQPVTLKPKESATVELKFRPSSRLPPFNEACNIEVAGSEHKLLTASGAAQGLEVLSYLINMYNSII